MCNQARHISFRQVCLPHRLPGHSVDLTYSRVNVLIYVGEPLVQNTASQTRSHITQNTDSNVDVSRDATDSSSQL